MDFRHKVNAARGINNIEFLRVKKSLAEVTLSQVYSSDRPNYMVYISLSHLAEVEELNIHLADYEELTSDALSVRLNVDALDLANVKYRELCSMLKQTYVRC